MTNVFFPEDKVTTDDLYFVCYMIERIARQLKQPNKYVANAMGHDELAKKLSLADVLHSENPLAVAADWIDEYQLKSGHYDVEAVNPELCSNIPTATQMGKVYKRLILNTLQSKMAKILPMASFACITIQFAKSLTTTIAVPITSLHPILLEAITLELSEYHTYRLLN